MTRVRWATPADVVAFYGEPGSPTMQAVVLDVGGQILAIGGIYYEGSRIIAFSDLKPGASSYKKSLMRGTKMVLELMRKKRRPVHAVRDPEVSTAPGFLAHLGFEQVGDYYEWHS